VDVGGLKVLVSGGARTNTDDDGEQQTRDKRGMKLEV
jgi:DhnA family fructose-bisphosphate aldolase class Ia